LGIVYICRLEIGVDIDCVARKGVKIDPTREDVQNLALIWEERPNSPEIPGRVTAIISSFHPIIVAHDPRAHNAAVLRGE
jgi:hypothetical protein